MKVVIFPGEHYLQPKLTYDVGTIVPTNPELWVSERIAANEEEFKAIYERAVKQWQEIEYKCKRQANERKMLERLVKFGQWVVDNRDELSRMRREDEENETVESYSRNQR